MGLVKRASFDAPDLNEDARFHDNTDPSRGVHFYTGAFYKAFR
jgi:hypothetical protein